MSKRIVELAGWYGVVAILLGYALLSFEVISSKSYVFQLLNFTGAIGIVVVSLAKKARQPALLNLVWAAIAFVAIISLVIG